MTPVEVSLEDGKVEDVTCARDDAWESARVVE